MPWLAGTALIHSLAVTEKRGAFKSWTVLLAILAFSLSLLGTFLVRSGVLSSVHAFATDPGRGIFILSFLGVVIGGSLALYAWRAPRLMTGGTFSWFSREALLLGNNVLLLAALGSVLLGTLYPLFMDALGLGKISVGPPYFNAVFIPLIAPVLFLTAIGPLARWKQASLPDMVSRMKWAFAVALIVAAIVPFTAGGMNLMASLGLFLALWILFSILIGFAERLKPAQGTFMQKLASLPRGYWGMQIAHAGLAVAVIGATVVSNFQSERDVRMNVGDHVELAGYRFTFQGVKEVPGPNYVAGRGTIEVEKSGSKFVLHPEKRIYNASGMPMTEAGIDYGIFRDVYVSLGEQLENGAWTVKVYHKPFVDWLWGGAFLLALGGALAASDRRYRIAMRKGQRESSEKTVTSGAAA
jgi:cytochrome c-type biogenesis protein CcmF